MKSFPVLLAIFFALGVWHGRAAVIAATGGGEWHSTTPNAPWPGGVVPQPTDDAIISANVTISTPATIHNLTITNGGTFFNESSLNIIGDLTLTNTITLQGGLATITIGGNLNIASNTTFNASQANIMVSGVTTVYGTLKDLDGGDGQDSFATVVVQPGGTWSLTDVTEWSVSGDLTNNGTITATIIPNAGGGITFTGGGNNIGGANGFTIPQMTVNGTYKNDVSLTNTASLAGPGSLTEGTNSSLTLGGTITLASFNAAAVPNTVSYNRAGAQTVWPASYYDLILTGSNIKTLAGSVNVADNVQVSSVAQAMVSGTVNVTGTTTIDTGAFLLGPGALNGLVVVNGTISPGVPLGTLTLSTSPILFGTVLLEINRTNAPNTDAVAVSGGPLSYGGTLTVANLGGTLQAGDTFQLFNASDYSGLFSATNLPLLSTNLNLAWSNTLNLNGTIAVVSTVTNSVAATNGPPAPLSYYLSGNTLNLSWDTNGFPGFHLQCDTNLGTDSWSDETNGWISPVVIPIDPTVGSVFFRLIHP